MKWVLAGLSFALLVALAIGTVAVKAQNVRARARIERIARDIEFCRMEVASRALGEGETSEYLARLWRQVLARNEVDSR